MVWMDWKGMSCESSVERCWLPAFIAAASFLMSLKRCCNAAAVVPSLRRRAIAV